MLVDGIREWLAGFCLVGAAVSTHNTGERRISFPSGFAFTLRKEPDGEPLEAKDGAFDISGRVYIDTDAADDAVIKALSEVSLSAPL